MIDNSFKRYFTFWFAHFANGSDCRSVLLENKIFYIRTKTAAEKHGKIQENSLLSLKGEVERLYEIHK